MLPCDYRHLSSCGFYCCYGSKTNIKWENSLGNLHFINSQSLHMHIVFLRNGNEGQKTILLFTQQVVSFHRQMLRWKSLQCGFTVMLITRLSQSNIDLKKKKTGTCVLHVCAREIKAVRGSERKTGNMSKGCFKRDSVVGGSSSFQFQTVSAKCPTEHNFLPSIFVCHRFHVNRGLRWEGQRNQDKGREMWSRSGWLTWIFLLNLNIIKINQLS